MRFIIFLFLLPSISFAQKARKNIYSWERWWSKRKWESLVVWRPRIWRFNGEEKDDELKGNGNSINYLARIYDPRLGNFLSVDPLTKRFPMLTPYQFASNTPIQAIDLDGLEGLIVVKMDKPPTNFNKTLFAKDLQQRLIESGAHKDTRVLYENSKAYNDMLLKLNHIRFVPT